MENKKEQSTASSLLRFAGPYKGKYILSIFLSVLGVASGLVPYYAAAQMLIGLIGDEREFSFYLMWGAVAAIGYIAKSCFSILSTSVSHTATFHALRDVRKQIVDKLNRMPMGTLLDTPSGQLKDILVDRVEGLETPLAHLLPEMSANVLVPIFIIVYLFVLDWRMALISLITIPVGMAFMATILKTYPQQYEGSVKINQQMNNAVVEYVNGIEVIKAFNRSAASYGKYADSVRYFHDSTMAWWSQCWLWNAAARAVLPSTLLGTLPVGAWLYMEGSLSLPVLLVALVVPLGFIAPLMKVSEAMEQVSMIKGNLEQVTAFLKTPELVRPTEPAELGERCYQFEDVHFAYNEAEILHGISFQTQPGTMTAIVGPSGSGKSTIAKLMAGFWDVTSGTVHFGGQDIRSIPFGQLMGEISYVAQDNFLFDKSIRENIRMGNPDASDEEVEAAAKAANCHDFIMQLEQGYDTMAGDAGDRLSGGERQRITIARAMLKQASVIILDEATAYADPENEALIQQAISKLVAGKSLIVVAHRLNTIRNADQILVVANGEIVGRGIQEELLANCPLYRKMWQDYAGSTEGGAEDV